MTKLPVLSGSELVKILQRAGFEKVRQKGSHVSLRKKTFERVFHTVVPMHREIDRGTLAEILRQAGLSRDDLQQLMET